MSKSQAPPLLSFSGVDQIGVLVPDLTAAMAAYARLWTIAPWRVWDYDRSFVPEMTYRGQSGDYSMRLALSSTTPQIELIEWRRGACVFEEWVVGDRFGVHHVGVYVPSVRLAVEDMRTSGLEPIQTGLGYGVDGDGGFAYFDTEPVLGVILELIEVPERRRKPVFTFPDVNETGTAAAQRPEMRP